MKTTNSEIVEYKIPEKREWKEKTADEIIQDIKNFWKKFYEEN